MRNEITMGETFERLASGGMSKPGDGYQLDGLMSCRVPCAEELPSIEEAMEILNRAFSYPR
ncbi:MAG: hypothetical protein ACD_56C00112G0005 [uncultured bacterium]|nr:MAG: hypothetical protein ACD_56C00112G0005 [uncultured bacterium]